jgi:hypothetical protein
MQDDPLRGNVPKARAIGNPVGDRLDAIVPVFGDEIANPFVIVAIENQILRALNNQAIYFDNFGASQGSLL